MHEAIARRLVEDPDRVMERARRTLTLMTEKHPSAAPLLREWKAILRRPASDVVDVLLDPHPRARELRQVTPFAGVLSPAERVDVYRRFAESEGAVP